MATLLPYHFARLRAADFRPFYQQVTAGRGFVCFDFEDSLDADSPAATRQLKQAQRRAVVDFLLARRGQLDFRRVGLRINAAGTADYAADLVALAALPALGCVFLPKAEEPTQLRRLLLDLPLAVNHVIPVLETAAAFARLPALLAEADPRLGRYAFGHCDYNLSCGHFPFFHHDSARYWEWLAELDRHCRAQGKQLLNSPMLQLNDAAAYQAMLARLAAYPSVGGQITLSLAQTRLCAAAPPPLTPLPSHDRPGAAACARSLVQRFARHRQPQSAFAVDADRELVSPHEVRAARRFLQA
jgi:citrate lyase beta subunit